MPVNGNHGREKTQNYILKLASQIPNEAFLYMDMTSRGLLKAELLCFVVCFLLWLIQKPILNLDSSLDSGTSPIRAVSASAVTKQQL